MVEMKLFSSHVFLALVDLNGRFFGGREVDADFYNVQDFHNDLLQN